MSVGDTLLVSENDIPEFLKDLRMGIQQKLRGKVDVRRPKRNPKSEVSLIHIIKERMLVKIWTSFNQDSERPNGDRYLHFLLLDLGQKGVHDIWHCKRLSYDGANPSETIAIAAARTEVLRNLGLHKRICNAHHQQKPGRLYYVECTHGVAWFCMQPSCKWYGYVPEWIHEDLIKETDKQYMKTNSIFDPSQFTVRSAVPKQKHHHATEPTQLDLEFGK
jgi:hypothetical protein